MIEVPALETVLKGETEKTELPWNRVGAPVDALPEQVFYHKIRFDEKGRACVKVKNPKLGMGICVEFPEKELPNFTQWKSMASGDFVVGLEPCNCHVDGQKWEEENGTLRRIGAGRGDVWIWCFVWRADVIGDAQTWRKMKERRDYYNAGRCREWML